MIKKFFVLKEKKGRKMKRFGTLLMVIFLLTGCTVKKQDSQMSVYHFQGISFTVPDSLDIVEEEHAMIVENDEWRLTFSTGTVGGQGSSMTPWQAFRMVMKDTYRDFKETTFCGQEAVQFTDENVGLCIYTYMQDSNSSELLAVKLYDYQGNHHDLIKNKDVSKILSSCTFEE